MPDNNGRIKSVLELVLELSSAQRAFAVSGDIVEAIRCQIRRDELFSELAMMERGQVDVGSLMEIIEGINTNDAETTIMLTDALAQTGDKLKRLKSGTKARNAYTAHQGL
ncbi:MAG: hypothetical protein AABY51_01995 [Deltaproteobacteria bacterium]